MAACDTESDFEFYLRFVKPLIFNLQEPRDRALAAAWVQKLMDKNLGSEDLRTTYLKLLLFVLQRKKLRGIFMENPNQIKGLEQFSEASLDEVARDLLATENELQDSPESGDFPPYCTDYSPDLLEYSAVQYIPNFGVHAYYAISNEPLPTWSRLDKAVFPRGVVRKSTTRIKVTTSKFSVKESTRSLSEQGLTEDDGTIHKTTSGNLIRRSVVILQSKTKLKEKSKNIVRYNLGTNQNQASAYSKIPRKSNLTNLPLSAPLGVPVKEEGIREAPVWGTNLLPVTEPEPWEPPTDIPCTDSDSIYFEYQNEPEIVPCPPCAPILKNRQNHGCGCPIKPKPKRPSSAAAAPEKDDYYYSEYQTNYFQALSLSNLVPPVQPCRSPTSNRKAPVPIEEHFDPNRRLHSFDIPGEGEVSVFYPSQEFPQINETVPEESSSFDIPYEGQNVRQRPPVGFPRKTKTGFPRPKEETEVRVIHAMDKRNFTSVQSRSGFVMPCKGEVTPNQATPISDASCQSDEIVPRPKRPTLPPIPERQQELYNFKTLSQGQAKVNRIIQQTLRNTKKIDENLKAFDRFISEYENKVDYSVDI